MPKLSALTVKSAKPGRHADGEGLYLLVKATGAKSWLLRVQYDGKRRDIGLGSFDSSVKATGKADDAPIVIPILQRRVLTLGQAREKAGLLRTAAKSGLDPIAERDRQRRSVPNFRQAAIAAHSALHDGWPVKGAKTFLSSLQTHAFPTMGDKRIDAVTADDITTVLAPIWTTKPDAGRKVRQRIAKVLNFAHGKGWRSTEAPGKSVTVGLPRQPQGGNYSAMPCADVPTFVADLCDKAPTIGRMALLFQIHTAARPGEVRGARWGQIDFAKRNWNRPAAMMKGVHAPAHTVALNNAAVLVLKQILSDTTPLPTDLVFPGRGGASLSNMTMAKVLRAAKVPYDAHAFRSSFRDWAAEKMPEIPDPVAEAALAHVVSDTVVRAYKRTNFLEMRRTLMDAWGDYCGGHGNVIGSAND